MIISLYLPEIFLLAKSERERWTEFPLSFHCDCPHRCHRNDSIGNANLFVYLAFSIVKSCLLQRIYYIYNVFLLRKLLQGEVNKKHQPIQVGKKLTRDVSRQDGKKKFI
jgi:hypothetical protein